MRKILLCGLAAALVVLPKPSATQLSYHGLKAEEFIEYVTVADPYTKWQVWPDGGGLHKGRAPHGHGALVTTYVNPAAFRSIGEEKGMAEGSMIVVENYTVTGRRRRTITSGRALWSKVVTISGPFPKSVRLPHLQHLARITFAKEIPPFV